VLDHEVPDEFRGSTLSLAAAYVAVLEEEYPHVLKRLTIRLCHLIESIEMRLDIFSGGAADEDSVENDTRIAYAFSGVDITALGADLGSVCEVVHAG
jgi:hypothetical protein